MQAAGVHRSDHVTCLVRYSTIPAVLSSTLYSGVSGFTTMLASSQVVSKQKPGGAQYMSHNTWVKMVELASVIQVYSKLRNLDFGRLFYSMYYCFSG